MAITITRDLNVVSVGVPPVIHLSQYDSDFTLVFNLYASTGAFTMPTGTTAEIRGTKRDGNGYDAAASVSGSTVTVTGDEQMTAIAGQNMFEIATYYNNKRLNTINFILDVERAALDADTITSESVLRELDAIIQGAATATQAAEDAEDAADRAEEAADDLSGTVQQVATNTQDIAGLKDDLEELREEVEDAGGLSETAKQALLACFENVRWVGDDGRDYYDALESALYPDTGLVSITAVFDPGSNVIYTDTPLDNLKAYLTVTGHYSNGTSKTVRTYALSGTLAEGTDTITVTYEGKTTTFSVTVVNALDRIAYDNLTYRDLFVTNNFIKIGNFDDITISTELVTLPNGDTYRISNGAPVISQDAFITGDSSLKVSIDSMSSQVNYKSTRMPTTATFLMAACVRVDEYTSGNVGMQVNVSNAGLSASMIGHTTRASTTDGFEEIVAVGSYTYDAATHPDANLNIFIGDYKQGYATAYIDACIATIVPSGMTLQEATQLYHDYINMVKS